MLLLGRDADVAKWVGTRLGGVFSHAFVGIGISSDEKAIEGGVIFHNWNGANVDLSVALDRPLRRGEVKGLRHYAFDQLKAQRCTMRPPISNRRAIRFLQKHATLEAVLPRHSPDGTALQFVVFADDPRWLRWKVEV